jgi:hypothetical protein
LPGHQVQRLAAQQSRDDRDLALNGKALRTIPVDDDGFEWIPTWKRDRALQIYRWGYS